MNFRTLEAERKENTEHYILKFVLHFEQEYVLGTLRNLSPNHNLSKY